MKLGGLFFLVLSLVSCGVQSSNESIPSNDSNEKLLFSCTTDSVGEDHYVLTINIYEGILEILQQSVNARFAQLRYPIVETGTIVSRSPEKFSCATSRGAPDFYNLRLDVFDDRVVVHQSAINARFAELFYAIKKPN